MSGSFAAMQKRLDPFGVLIIAFVTSVGGGTIRDLILDVPVFWMHDMVICSVIFITTIVSMIFKSVEKKFKVTLFIFDSFGLGLFTIIGIQKGINADLHPLICITLGTITGCFGGISRDILLNRIPLIFRKEIYATACIIGGTIFLGLVKYSTLSYAFVQVSTILLIVAIRTFAVKYHWEIPKFYGVDNSSEM
ncbi:trimeric intracellular cation channel family protein [Kaistella treverensis]